LADQGGGPAPIWCQLVYAAVVGLASDLA
jgi:hypothetical protein